MDAEEKFASLEDEQLEDVAGGGEGQEVIITSHDPKDCVGWGGTATYYHCLDPSDYRCPDDGGEILSKYRKDTYFPFKISRHWWWECMYCGRKFAPQSSDLVKVDHSVGGGAFRSW